MKKLVSSPLPVKAKENFWKKKPNGFKTICTPFPSGKIQITKWTEVDKPQRFPKLDPCLRVSENYADDESSRFNTLIKLALKQKLVVKKIPDQRKNLIKKIFIVKRSKELTCSMKLITPLSERIRVVGAFIALNYDLNK